MNDINVIVVNRGRKYLYLRYTDPVTGQDIEKSARTSSKREATKRAGEWQAELRAGKGGVKSRLSWADFREDFECNYLADLSPAYQTNVSSTFNVIEDAMRPDQLRRVSKEWLKQFRQKVSGRPDATVHKYFQHLKTALNWAHREGYISEVPVFPKQKKDKAKAKRHMKGRPITAEEFDRMIAAVEKIFPSYKNEERMADQKAASIESIRYLLNGLWVSGLRLGEALVLTWDQWADGIRIQVDGPDVFLLIDSEDQKNRETELHPVTPDFSDFLLSTPPSNRHGFVFNPKRARKVSRRVDTVSDWIVDVGEKAGVKVDQKDGQPVYASAHDLRRAFGDRWSRIVEPLELRDLMRHASVATTEQFYLAKRAKRTATSLRKRLGGSNVTLDVTPTEKRHPKVPSE